MKQTRLARRRGFQCLHRYKVDEWTQNENQATFGACFTPSGHGHNYELEAYLEGEPDPVTGMILNLVDVDNILGDVLSPLDGKHLNFDVPAFKDKVPTTEVLAQYIFAQLERRCEALPAKLVKIRLYEYEDLWVDVWA